VSNFGDESKGKRLRWRHLLPLAVLALASILLVQAGSAARPPVTKFEICVQNATNGTPTPTCGGAATSVFDGNTVATLNVSVENDGTSTTAIQSANINLPSQLIGVATSGSPSDNVTVSASNLQVVQIRGVKIQPGKSFVATFQVDVACGGQFSWDASEAASGDNLTGTPFGYQTSPSSTGVSTSITTNATTGCHLGFAAQPTDTKTGSKIWDAGASQGGPIKVGLFLGTSTTPMTSCPVGYSTCGVNIDSPAGLSGTTTQPLSSSLVASFPDLSLTIPADHVADQFNLEAIGDPGPFAPPVTSSSFLVAQNVAGFDCTGNSCTLPPGHAKVSGSNLTDSFVDVGTSAGFTFMTLSPFTVGTTPLGCTGRVPLPVAGFAESDGRQEGSGTLTIKYYVNKDVLSSTQGKNVGNQFTPICVGGRPVDIATGAIKDCGPLEATTANPSGVGGSTYGWKGDALNPSTHKFTGGPPVNAVCNSDGYYWGIIGSFQDNIPAGNPVVTGWGGTSINSTNYREFDMTIPPGWDWRSGP
jgi:hypothetical protein